MRINLASNFKKLFKYNFVKSASFLQISSFFSFSLTFIASVIYARILGVEGYATYGLIFAYVGLVGILMNAGTNDSTITLLSRAYAKGDREKIKNLVTFYVKITLAVSLAAGIILIIISPLLTGWLYQNIEIGKLAGVVIASQIISLFFRVYTIVLQASGKIKILAITETLEKAVYFIFPAGLVLLGFGIYGLVYGYLAASLLLSAAGFLLYHRARIKMPFFPAWHEIIFNFPRVALRYYVKFSFLIAINKNLGNLMTHLPIFILGMFASLGSISYFKIALAYVTIPGLLLSPVSRLLNIQLPKSEVSGQAYFKEHFYKTSLIAGSVNFVLLIPLLFFAPFLVKLVYGPAYLPSLSLIYILFLYSLISGFTVGFGAFYRTVGRMKLSILINASQIVFTAAAMFILSGLIEPARAVVYSLVAMAILFSAVNYSVVYSYFNQKENEKNCIR